LYRAAEGGGLVEIRERSHRTTETIDIPVPSDELLQSLEPEDLIQVEEIPREAEHFSTNYRRC
jgi:hypothetical protein